MYAEYLKERENKDILQNEKGFAIYGYNCISGVDFPHVYIQDIYTKPQFRKGNVASELADQIAEKAKTRSIKIMFGSIDTNANGADISLQVLMSYGMKLYAVNDDTIFMTKELT